MRSLACARISMARAILAASLACAAHQADGYAVTGYHGERCPAGMAIGTAAECAEAAKAIGGPDVAYPETEHDQHMPSGCYLSFELPLDGPPEAASAFGVTFNQDLEGGAGHPADGITERLICRSGAFGSGWAQEPSTPWTTAPWTADPADGVPGMDLAADSGPTETPDAEGDDSLPVMGTVAAAISMLALAVLITARRWRAASAKLDGWDGGPEEGGEFEAFEFANPLFAPETGTAAPAAGPKPGAVAATPEVRPPANGLDKFVMQAAAASAGGEVAAMTPNPLYVGPSADAAHGRNNAVVYIVGPNAPSPAFHSYEYIAGDSRDPTPYEELL